MGDDIGWFNPSCYNRAAKLHGGSGGETGSRFCRRGRLEMIRARAVARVQAILDQRKAELNGAIQSGIRARIDQAKNKLSDEIANALKKELNTTVSRTDQWIDPFVGFKARYYLTDPVYLTRPGGHRRFRSRSGYFVAGECRYRLPAVETRFQRADRPLLLRGLRQRRAFLPHVDLWRGIDHWYQFLRTGPESPVGFLGRKSERLSWPPASVFGAIPSHPPAGIAALQSRFLLRARLSEKRAAGESAMPDGNSV